MNVKKSKLIVLGLVLSIIFNTTLFFATRVLGLSASVAGTLYYALQVVSLGATAAAIVSSFGLAGFSATAIWAYAKKKGFTWFVKW